MSQKSATMVTCKVIYCRSKTDATNGLVKKSIKTYWDKEDAYRYLRIAAWA